MVVFISGISFVGYILMKWFGEKKCLIYRYFRRFSQQHCGHVKFCRTEQTAPYYV